MSATILETITLTTVTCCQCGIVFAMPNELQASLQKTKDSFYCPNGHSQSYTKSFSEQLRKQLEQIQRELRQEKCNVLTERQMRQSVEQENNNLVRKLKHVHKGTCPCCKRSFENLRRHMETKHPESKL